MTEKKETKGQKNLLKSFNQNGSSTPKNVFTKNAFNDKIKKAKKKAKPRKTSVKMYITTSDKLIALENILKFKNIDEITNYLINLKIDSLNSHQRVAFNAFRQVLDAKRK